MSEKKDDVQFRAELLRQVRDNKPVSVEDILELESRTIQKERSATAKDRAEARAAKKLAMQEAEALHKEREAYEANAKAVPDKPVLPLEQITQNLRDRHIAAIEKYGNSVDFSEVGRQVVQDLEAQKRAVVLTLLGMDNSFGRWEVKDYKNTPIGNLMEEACGGAMREWVQRAITEVFTDEKQNQIRTLLRTAVRKYLADHVSRAQGYELEQQVRDLLGEISHGVLNEVRREMNLPERTRDEKKRW